MWGLKVAPRESRGAAKRGGGGHGVARRYEPLLECPALVRGAVGGWVEAAVTWDGLTSGAIAWVS